jgi:hypothetical protein
VTPPRGETERPPGRRPDGCPESAPASAADQPLAKGSASAVTITAARQPAGKRARIDGHPSNWPEISKSIRFGRAGGRCECEDECGTGHQARCAARHGEPHPVTGSKVVLTTAHLDRNPWNSNPANLKAMCQRCHLAYDAEQHRESAAWTRAGRPAIQLELDLFLGGAA